MGKINGKVAVITGGDSGIGLATAQRFVADGAYVFITGGGQSELDDAVKQIGHNVTRHRGDVRGSLTSIAWSRPCRKPRASARHPLRQRGLAKCPAASHHRGPIRPHVRRQRQRHPLHRPESPATPARRRVNHPDVVDRRFEGPGRPQRVQRDQGGVALVRAHLDHRSQAPQDPGERSQSRKHRYARAAGTRADG